MPGPLLLNTPTVRSGAYVVVERTDSHRLAVTLRARADIIRACEGGSPRDRLGRRVIRRVAGGRLPAGNDDRTKRLHGGAGAVGTLVQAEGHGTGHSRAARCGNKCGVLREPLLCRRCARN